MEENTGTSSFSSQGAHDPHDPHDPHQMYRVRFVPAGVEISVPRGVSVTEAALKAGVTISLPCGGKGLCLNCGLRVLEGEAPVTDGDREAFTPDELERGLRLACTFSVGDDVVIETAAGAAAGKEDFGSEPVERPHFEIRTVKLPPPSLEEQSPDLDRLRHALGRPLKASLSALRTLSRLAQRGRPTSFSVASVGNLVLSAAHSPPFFGLALDIGTTTVAGALVDIRSAETRAAASTWNRQAAYGADVISRIKFTIENPQGLSKLKKALDESIGELVGRLLRAAGTEAEKVVAAAAAGNPTMIHTLLGLEPHGLARAPYVGVCEDMFELPAWEVGIPILSDAPVLVLPGIGSNVGADITADLLVTPPPSRGAFVLVDLGTNAEIALGTPEGVYVCSTAAGPAFEGGEISHGMRAGDGAVDHVWLSSEGDAAFNVVGGGEARGICGSGLFDLLALLLDTGIVDFTGRLLPPAALPASVPRPLCARVEERDGTVCFSLDGIRLTAKDVRQVQLAKGAVRAGIEALLLEADVEAENVEALYIAGAFGNFVRPKSAKRIGLIPPEIERVVPLGNAAGRGARLALLCDRAREKAESLARTARYVELAGNAKWRDLFADAMAFPERSEER